MSEYATFLKVGTAALVLSMIEDGYTVPNVELEEPVKAIREISRDPTLKKPVKLEDGRELTAIDIQRLYWERAAEYLASHQADKVLHDVLAEWGRVLNGLQTSPMGLVREIDWVTKKWIMESYMQKKGCGWDDPRLAMMDLQYHDINRNRGLYYLLAGRDKIRTMVDEEAIERAKTTPPQTTRAKVRGDFIRFARAKNRSYTVDWTYLKLNGYWEETILCMDPFCAMNRRVDELLAQVPHNRLYP
jgi:proteasome accessory factor A